MFEQLISKFKKLWSWVKAHGKIIGWGCVLVVVAIVALIMRGKSQDTVTTLWDMIKDERLMHKERVTKIDEIHTTEIKAREAAADRAVDAVKQAEEQYKNDNQALDAKKKKEIAAIVKKSSDNPELLARRLAEQFGFKYVSKK